MQKIHDPQVLDGSSQQPLLFQAPGGTEVRVTFDEPQMTSDAGLVLLAQDPFVQKAINKFSSCLTDPRRTPVHGMEEMVAQRVFQILAGYEDGNDCDTFRDNPLFKLLVGREAGDKPLASQPTISRLENLPGKRELIKLFYCQLDLFVESYGEEIPEAIVVDMDPTAVITHGQQEFQFYNGHIGDHCLMPFHVYEGLSGKLIATVLRSGTTPTAGEVQGLLRRIARHLRSAWPEVQIIFRADSHHTKPAVMDWCEKNKVDFITGLSPNKKLNELFAEKIAQAKANYESLCAAGRENDKAIVFADGNYAANTWSHKRRVVCRVYHGPLGSDVRYIVTSFREADSRYLYTTVYSGRGNAELMIKEHKLGLHSDRMSCTRAEANQFRLFLHSLAYTLLHRFRGTLLKGSTLARASFTRIRLELLKSAARITIRKTFVRFHLSEHHPLKRLWRELSVACSVLQSESG